MLKLFVSNIQSFVLFVVNYFITVLIRFHKIFINIHIMNRLYFVNIIKLYVYLYFLLNKL
jgi:hypothetical protein